MDTCTSTSSEESSSVDARVSSGGVVIAVAVAVAVAACPCSTVFWAQCRFSSFSFSLSLLRDGANPVNSTPGGEPKAACWKSADFLGVSGKEDVAFRRPLLRRPIFLHNRVRIIECESK